MKKTYGGSAFDRIWKQMKYADLGVVSKRQAKFWFREGFKELQRIQCAKAAREKKPNTPPQPEEILE